MTSFLSGGVGLRSDTVEVDDCPLVVVVVAVVVVPARLFLVSAYRRQWWSGPVDVDVVVTCRHQS